MCTKKRKGGFLVDALLGMMILLFGIIPLAASVSFAYRTLTGSVGMTNNLNEKVYDTIDREILACTLYDPTGAATATFFGGLIGPLTFPPAGVSTISSDYGTYPTALYYKPIDVSFDNRGNKVKIYVVK